MGKLSDGMARPWRGGLTGMGDALPDARSRLRALLDSQIAAALWRGAEFAPCRGSQLDREAESYLSGRLEQHCRHMEALIATRRAIPLDEGR